MNYIDAHCHLNIDKLPADIAVAITNATHPDDWARVAHHAGRGGIYGAIGVHPWRVANLADDWAQKMRELLVANPSLMIGEIGLDKNHPDMGGQVEVFTTQLQMAAALGRVAHIHCVGAWDRLLDALRTTVPSAIVLHGAATSPEIMRALSKYNVYFSFGRAICNPAHARAHASLRAAPPRRLLSESDSDNPVDVVPVVRSMSEILACSLAELQNTIYNNAVELLKNGQTI